MVNIPKKERRKIKLLAKESLIFLTFWVLSTFEEPKSGTRKE
jgi:hypothetical protein